MRLDRAALLLPPWLSCSCSQPKPSNAKSHNTPPQGFSISQHLNVFRTLPRSPCLYEMHKERRGTKGECRQWARTVAQRLSWCCAAVGTTCCNWQLPPDPSASVLWSWEGGEEPMWTKSLRVWFYLLLCSTPALSGVDPFRYTTYCCWRFWTCIFLEAIIPVDGNAVKTP